MSLAGMPQSKTGLGSTPHLLVNRIPWIIDLDALSPQIVQGTGETVLPPLIVSPLKRVAVIARDEHEATFGERLSPAGGVALLITVGGCTIPPGDAILHISEKDVH